MSRTYRRNNQNQLHFSSLDDHLCDFLWEVNGGRLSCCVRIRPEKGSKLYKQRLAKFQSDAGPVCNAPAIARKIEERKYRNKAKQEVRKFVKDMEHEVQVDKAIKNVNWYYF